MFASEAKKKLPTGAALVYYINSFKHGKDDLWHQRSSKLHRYRSC